jgi:hypothetical protein
MLDLKNKKIILLKWRYFFLNLILVFLVIGVVDGVIFYGSKYEFFPAKIINLLFTPPNYGGVIMGFRNYSDMYGQPPEYMTWKLGLYLFPIVFIIVYGALIYKWSKLNKCKFFKFYEFKIFKMLIVTTSILFRFIIILILSFLISFSDMNPVTEILHQLTPSFVKEKIIIDCPNKTVQFGPVKYHKELNYCKLCFADRERVKNKDTSCVLSEDKNPSRTYSGPRYDGYDRKGPPISL